MPAHAGPGRARRPIHTDQHRPHGTGSPGRRRRPPLSVLFRKKARPRKRLAEPAQGYGSLPDPRHGRLFRTGHRGAPQRRQPLAVAQIRVAHLQKRTAGSGRDRHHPAGRQISRDGEAALRGLHAGEHHQDLHRNQPPGEETAQAGTLRFRHAPLQPSGLLPHRVLRRLDL